MSSAELSALGAPLDTSDGAPVPTHSLVLRVVKKDRYVPAGQRLPLPDAFAPSSDDEAHSVETGKPIRLSVWDRSLTTPAQARAARQTDAVLSAFAIEVADIHAAAARLQLARTRVVFEPHENPALPGAAGHAGIEGCDTKNAAGKKHPDAKAVRDLRADLSKACKVICRVCDEIDSAHAPGCAGVPPIPAPPRDAGSDR